MLSVLSETCTRLFGPTRPRDVHKRARVYFWFSCGLRQISFPGQLPVLAMALSSVKPEVWTRSAQSSATLIRWRWEHRRAHSGPQPPRQTRPSLCELPMKLLNIYRALRGSRDAHFWISAYPSAPPTEASWDSQPGNSLSLYCCKLLCGHGGCENAFASKVLELNLSSFGFSWKIITTNSHIKQTVSTLGLVSGRKWDMSGWSANQSICVDLLPCVIN